MRCPNVDLKDQLTHDMKLAMKDKDKVRLSVIRMIKASVKKMEIDKKLTLSNDETLDVIVREMKQRRDSIAEFERAGREDLVEKEKEELTILQAYLPEQLSEEELRSLIQQEIERLGAISKADMGKVMGCVVPKIKGKADGKAAQKIVQELLK